MTQEFETDESYQTIILVGEKEKGTRHPHLFVAERDTDGIQLFFVDPEHAVGKQNILRPRIGNLMALRIYNDRSDPELAILRYRTKKIEEKDITVLKLQPQLEAARKLIHNEGVPKFLQGKEEEILFRIVIKQEKGLAQARYTNKKSLQSFLQGGKGSSLLEGKADSQQAIVNRFIQYMEEGRFGKVEQKPRSVAENN
ncbi:MAG: hypothetical protein G01um101429_49 [Parcubacteria group bacterium Gr01-1014_29]|nr:MAG: hypothetical protein G01um101429_49 [Parcubacteria group bacterium Gr01-1014_29]